MKIIYCIVLLLLIIILCSLNKNINSKNTFEYFNDKINFTLYNMKNQLIKNENWEYNEQKILGEYVKENDNILQLGGNIGGSCIYVDKIIKKNNINLCVEPNSKVIKTLIKNKEFNNSNFQIIQGVISDKTNLKLSNDNNSIDKNFWGSKIIKNGEISVKSYPLKSIKNYDKINVLFADCEGCLEQFLDEYDFFIKQLRLIIYEEDQKDICNYDKIENKLKKQNFTNIKNINNIKVWIKS